MHPTELSALSATEAARLIRDGAISSEQYVAACLARIREVDARIEAWAFFDPDHALAQARAADRQRQSGQPLGPLHGVPIGIKDIIDTADMPTENGSPLHAGRMPSRDAAVVALLRAAGAVVIGKTVTTEFACGGPGKTRNPHDPEYSPGGSSSGSAAAVAAGMVPLALGSQTAGSTVRPASYCGIYGLKPTRGLIPRRGMSRVSHTLDTVGVFARTLDDIALLLESCVGYDEGEFESAPRARAPYRAITAAPPPTVPRLGFVKTPHWNRMDADAQHAFANLIDRLGDRVEAVELPDAIERAWDWHTTIMESEIAVNLAREWDKGGARLTERLRTRIERGRTHTAASYLEAVAQISRLNDGVAALLAHKYDALLTPASTGVAPSGLASTGDPMFCSLWTLCGLPALSTPLLRGANGLPIGAQLVGARHDDGRLLRTARWLVDTLPSRA
jgi:Asp-tRNA(Asn)/Glu-tRNA(Gln) amidotransferase A subunit family amidase